MRVFSTFTGIGGFEIGIRNAYRSTLGRIQEDSPRSDEAGKGLLPTEGEDPGTKKGSVSASTSNKSDERSLRPNQPGEGSISRGSSRPGDSVERALVPTEPLFVGYSEIDRYAIETYEKHFKGVDNYGDITKINAAELPDFDCLVGGFPCQAFSIAGKRRGFEDTRGTLFFDLARILKEKQPRLFVFENVKGLLSHKGGRTFATIIATIDELGYDCQWQVLNSKDFGVPQNRERVIIVGHLRGTPRPKVFPITQTSGATIRRLNTPIHSTDRYYSPEGISPALSTMQGGGRQPFVAFSRAEVGDDSEAHTTRVREASRVPGPVDTMSDSQRYKMAGNAVTTNVIQAVFERIFESERA